MPDEHVLCPAGTMRRGECSFSKVSADRSVSAGPADTAGQRLPHMSTG